MNFEIKDEKLIEFGNLLKKLRFENNYTFEELKKITNINIADLSRLENAGRKKINPFHLLSLSNIYKINVLEFYEMLGYIEKNMIDSYTENKLIKQKINNYFSEKENSFKKIPLYLSLENYFENMEIFPDNFIYLPLQDSSDLKSFYIIDDSMSPTLKLSDIVIFDLDIKSLKNMDIGIFLHDDRYIFRRFYKLDSKIILQSDNHFYEPIIISETQKFKILGKFKGIVRI